MAARPHRKLGEPLFRPMDYTIRPNGCWVWNWSVHQKGYATVRVGEKGLKAHRVSYEMANGPIPDGLVVRHLCGNPSCLNPEHLQAGTPAENARDMVEAGTQGHQKLTMQDAKEIRRIYAQENISYAGFGRQFGVIWGSIRNVVLNKSFYDPSYQPPEKSLRKSSSNRLGQTMANEIRQEYLQSTISQETLAEKFQTSRASISEIVRNLLYPQEGYVYPGRKSHNQKLNKEKAVEIQERYRKGQSQSQLAEEYCVSQSSISLICSGKFYGDSSKRPAAKIESTPPRPSLRSLNGPAPTGKEEQERRLDERRDSGRRPLHKPGDPLFTQEDWVVDSETGCHNWKWGKVENRPQATRDDGSRCLAYRATWEARFGPIPEGLSVNHLCNSNNGRCVNTDHLYVGDHYDNMRDTVLAGNHVKQVLSFEQAQDIRIKYEPPNTTYKMLSVQYGVSTWTIQGILKNKEFYDPNYVPNLPQVSVLRKLTMQNATVIRERYKNERVTMSQLGREYGVYRSVVSSIVRNETTYHDPNYNPPLANEVRGWKLSSDDVVAIKAEHRQGGVSLSRLAKKYGVDPSRISQIVYKMRRQ